MEPKKHTFWESKFAFLAQKSLEKHSENMQKEFSFSFQPFDLFGVQHLQTAYFQRTHGLSCSEMRQLFGVVGLVKPGAFGKGRTWSWHLWHQKKSSSSSSSPPPPPSSSSSSSASSSVLTEVNQEQQSHTVSKTKTSERTRCPSLAPKGNIFRKGLDSFQKKVVLWVH